jgi:hypothetical protein
MSIYKTTSYIYYSVFGNALTKPQNNAKRSKQQIKLIKIGTMKFRTPPYEKKSHVKIYEMQTQTRWGGQLNTLLVLTFYILLEEAKNLSF